MGLRLEALVATQDPPFLALPYINLRGVPAMRYQGEMTVLTETEHMVNVYRGWSLVGFTGIGSAAPI
jgi:hypothetical protein